VKKVILFAGMAVIALLPAVIGLTSNPSLSARVPLQPAQVQVTEAPTGSPTSAAVPSTTRPRPSTPAATRSDDHGGDRTEDDDHGHGRGRAAAATTDLPPRRETTWSAGRPPGPPGDHLVRRETTYEQQGRPGSRSTSTQAQKQAVR